MPVPKSEPEPRKTAEQIFKEAWHEADARGEIGSRVIAGLEALRNAGYLRVPISNHEAQDQLESMVRALTDADSYEGSDDLFERMAQGLLAQGIRFTRQPFTTTPKLDGVDLTRDAVSLSIGKVLSNIQNYPPQVQYVMLGVDISELRGKLTDSVMDLVEPEVDDTPCKAEIDSWAIYRPEQIDRYYIRCTELGVHTKHKNGELGCSWQ